MNEDIIVKLNKLLSNPSMDQILALFDIDGYIRLNMVYISPLHISMFKSALLKYGLIELFINAQGLGFVFKNFRLNFFGNINITYKKNRNMIFCIEINFDPIIDNNCGVPIMNEIEDILKYYDVIFFMTYSIDIDKEILHNSLSDSADFLYKRNLENTTRK